jgi:Protein of unknown function (DUF3892)
MKKYLVTCTNKHAQHERIESIGCVDPTSGVELHLSENEAIAQIEAKTIQLIVRDDRGHEATVEVEEREGRKFLITRRDRFKTDNLDALPRCSGKPIIAPQPYKPVVPARSHSVRNPWKGR